MAKIIGGGSNDWGQCEQRQTPRRVVPEGIAISVELELEDATLWTGQCRDISLAGMLVEFPDQHIPQVLVDKRVLLTLSQGGEVASRVPGIIRHGTEHRMGILFPEAWTRTVDEENHLFHILRTVEQEVWRQKPQG